MIETYQTDINSVHYTSEQLKCCNCNKSQHIVLQIMDGPIYCLDCFTKNVKHLIMGKEFIKIREIINLSFGQKKIKQERNKMSYALRYEILKRDNFKCVLCGSSDKLEIDHKIAISKGGETKKENLQTLCFNCNRGKFNS